MDTPKFGLKDLHDYQDRTVTRIYENNRTLAVVPMGGGKTVTTLTALRELMAEGAISHVWVIAPKRVALSVWPGEPPLWEHLQGLVISVVAGTEKQRLKAMAVEADVHVINFENVQWLSEQIHFFDADDAVVIDEITRMKNPQSKRAKTLLKMMRNVSIRIGLTGTPKPKDVKDLFMQVLLVFGEKTWGASFYKWRQKYFYPTDFQQYNWEPRPEYGDLLDQTFAQLAYIVPRKDMMQAIVEPVMLEERIRLPKPALVAHDTALRAWVLKATGESGKAVVELLASAAVGSMKARQIASGCVYDDDGETHVIHREKLDALSDIVGDAGEPVIVAYQFRHELAEIRKLFPNMVTLGEGVSDREAENIIREWNAGNVPVLGLHPRSGGHGLNLQYGGRRLVWFTLPWSLEEFQQTNARVARQGQKDVVYIHSLVAAGTVDEAVVARLQQRADAQTLLLQMIAAAQSR